LKTNLKKDGISNTSGNFFRDYVGSKMWTTTRRV
jgi:hypothetical protein